MLQLTFVLVPKRFRQYFYVNIAPVMVLGRPSVFQAGE
jgi:hypothetical protein